MQIEDPRIRYKQLQNEKCSTESIPMQPLHGSPYHVYPASNFPAVKAFQGPNPSLQSVSASPLLSTKSQIQMEMSPILRQGSPQTPRMGSLPRRQTIQETSFSNNIDTDAVVAKINNMFPTASDSHIRLLLKKYLKNVFPKVDETLLLDILANSDNNVQKASEKLIAMGYTKRDVVPPKLSNRIEESKKVGQAGTEERIIPLHPKILSSEEKIQIKNRLQEKYNKIAERIITMALESVNFSEDRACQILQIVQQEDESKARKVSGTDENKKMAETIPEESQPATESSTSDPSSASKPTSSQAHSTRAHDISADTTTCLLSSSILFSNSGATNDSSPSTSTDSSTPKAAVKKTKKTRFRAKRESLKNSLRGTPEEDQQVEKKPEFKSIVDRVDSKGHNSDLSKGPDDSLLLADYVTWNGANPDISIGRRNVALGSDQGLLTERGYSPRGHNAELCKGPNVGLVKGSIYSQLNQNLAANVKCN